MFDTAILVLLYNKTLKESETLNSLLNSDVHYEGCKIVIWNNGPERLQDRDVNCFKSLGYQVTINETLDNKALSVIYNTFISDNDAEKYIILDDDSSLNSEFIKHSLQSHSGLLSMPQIMAQGVITSPKVNGISYDENLTIGAEDKVITIGSGLVVGSEIVSIIKANYGSVFDERFYLYGVDTTFCLRVHNCALSLKINVIPGFEHSLSRLEDEDGKIKDFRNKELSYDLGLTLRYYEKGKKFYYRLFAIITGYLKRLFLARKNNLVLIAFLKAVFTGRHYRDSK